jgi:hypothetical protein
VQLDEEMFCGTVRVRALPSAPYTVIVPRRGCGRDGRVWLIVNGVWTTMVSMVDSEVVQLCALLTRAQRARG